MADGVVVNKNQFSVDNDIKENIDKNSTQLESLMEKLRSRKQHQSSWIVLHTSLSSEKKLANLECLQKQVILLQNTVKVTSLMYLVERLEVISNQVGLKFTASDSSFTDLQMSSVMFVVRLLLTPDGGVRDVQISHSSDSRASTSCLEMSESVKAGKFDELKRHLEGLAALYDFDGDKKLKQMMFRAIQSLEADLNTLNRPSSIVNVAGYVHKTPLGLLSARTGGLPMKMTYFVGPYDLLNHKTHKSTPMTIEAILENNIGYSVTVCIERSTPHRLQTAPSIKPYDNKGGTSSINGNCVVLPAVFVLNLQSPMALSVGVIDKLRQIPGVVSVESGPSRSLAALLVEHMIDSTVRDYDAWEKHSLVTLLGSSFHRYFLLTSGDIQASQCLQASLINKIQFTQPSCVPVIIGLLRQQALFNTLLSSCLRPSCTTKDSMKLDAKIVCFDVTPISHQHISVMFEHPYRQSLTIVELDLSDIANVRCRMTSSNAADNMCTDEYASKIFQRSLSLPITLRAILHKAAVEFAKRPYRPPTPVTSSLPVIVYPNVSLSRRLSTTAPVDTITTRSVTVMLQPVTTRTVVPQSSAITLPVAAMAPHSTARGIGNPMLASLLDPEFSNRASSPAVEPTGDRSRIKRLNDSVCTVASKRRPSNDEAALTYSSSSPGMRQAVTTRSVTIPVARSFSVPSQSAMSCRPTIKLETPSTLPTPSSKSSANPQIAQLQVKLETIRPSADFKQDVKPPNTPQQRTNSNSELINLLSADDFDIQRNGDVGSAQDCRGAGGQYDGSCDRSIPQFRAPNRTVSNNGFNSSGGGGSNSAASTSGGGVPGGILTVAGVSKPINTDSWESSGNGDGMNWQMSPTPNDEMRPRSATPKNNHLGHLMNVTNNVVIKSEMIACDDVLLTNDVAADSKPPITVKFKRKLVKPSTQRRGTPQSDSALDRAAWKERVKQSLKAHPSACESSPGEALDFEVDGLTSGVRDVSPASPSQFSSSPRLQSGGALVVNKPKIGEKRQRVMNRVGRLPAEKKPRKDDGRKLSRKIYEFDDDGDVFHNSAAPMEKISTIKITKSDGRLQIQQPPRSSSIAGTSATRPMQQLHKSSNPGVSGSSHTLMGQKMNRPASHPVRPSIRPKIINSARSDSKITGSSAVVRPKQLAGTPLSDVTGVPMISSAATKAVSGSAKPALSSGSLSGGTTKTKVIAAGSVKKSSLNAVIDKLTKSATSGTEPAGKELYDQIRLEIIREGNKPSTPTRDLSSVKISSSVTTKRPDTPKDATAPRPTIPVRKPIVTTSIPLTSSSADPPKSVVRFTAPPASPPSVTAARVSVETVSVVVPRIPRDQLQSTGDRMPPSTVIGAITRPPLLNVRPPDPPGATCESGSSFRAFVGPRPRLQSSPQLVSPTFESPRYRMPEMAVRFSSHDIVSRSSEMLSPMADPLYRFALDDSADRLSTRHFMDAMTHSNADGTSVNGTTTPQVVDRHMSPPRSPSPTPVTQSSNSLSADVSGVEGLNSSKWTAKPGQQNTLEAVSDQVAVLASCTNSRARVGPESTLEFTNKKPSQITSVGKDWPGAITSNKIENSVDERKLLPDDVNNDLEASESSVSLDSPVAKRSELNTDRKQTTSSVKTDMQSPHSSASSPDASLIIDCYPGTPVVPIPAAIVASPPEQANLSAAVEPAHSPADKSSPSCVIVDVDDARLSPSHSGEVVNREMLSPGDASDGCPTANGDIDDDLMNEALIL